MSKWNELKSWAEAVIGLNKTNQWDWVASVEDGRLGKTHTSFALAANPAAILELIAENERLKHERDAEGYPPCDYCGTIPDYHPWHGSGLIRGHESPHIHACNSCRHLLPGKEVRHD